MALYMYVLPKLTNDVSIPPPSLGPNLYLYLCMKMCPIEMERLAPDIQDYIHLYLHVTSAHTMCTLSHV